MTAEDLSPVSKVTEYMSPTLSTPTPTSVLLSRVLWTGLWSKKQDQVRFLEQKMNRCVRVRYWWPRSPNRREVGGRGGGVQGGVLTERAQLAVHVVPDRVVQVQCICAWITTILNPSVLQELQYKAKREVSAQLSYRRDSADWCQTSTRGTLWASDTGQSTRG